MYYQLSLCVSINRYSAFRDEEGNYTVFYWQLLCVRLGFVIMFEHLVFGICKLIDILVPDIPESLEIKIKREQYLAKQALADHENINMEVSGRILRGDLILFQDFLSADFL